MRLMRTPLLSPAELAELADVVLLDTRATPEHYDAGHLRNAIYANLESDLSTAKSEDHDPSHGGRHPLPALDAWCEKVGAWGITPETDVVVYDDQSGANAAARAWWMLRAIGHERVTVLDGGFQAAVDAGLPMTTDVPSVAPKPPYPAAEWTRPTVSRDEVNKLRHDPSWIIVDVRSGERFRGETEPIDPIAGHIPGAVNLFFGENLRAGRFKPAEMLRAQYKHFLGGRAGEKVIVHCGSGVTACHTLLALEAAGIEGASLYVGSWSEWCRNEL